MKKAISLILICIIIFNLISIFRPKTTMALSENYSQSLKIGIDSFPESYKPYLDYLHQIHSNWNFKAYYTGIDWSEVTSSQAENRCLKNTIYKLDLMDPTIPCRCGKMGDPGYYCASAKTVNYYLDPRNHLSESSVYQFLDLSNSSSVSRDVIANVVKGTYLEDYIDTIMQAANEANVNPMHIVVTIFQEIGKKSKNEIPKAISGTVPGYEGYYNFYNYGANDGNGAVERGLEKAKAMGWTSKEYALKDGAIKILGNDYINKGQVTKYFYKFDVVGNQILKDNETKSYSSSLFYEHQYMTNVQDPESQAGMLMEYYTNNGLSTQDLTFIIPVYNNMPSVPCKFPSSLTEADGELYTINTIHVSSLNVKDANGNPVGKVTKAQPVIVDGINNHIATIRLKDLSGNMRTLYLGNTNSSSNYAENYLTKYNEVKPVVIQKSEFKLEGSNFVMTPTVKVSDIKQTYPNAIITTSDGTTVVDQNASIGTGYRIIIDDGTAYTVVKYGDINGDGNINSGDLLRLQKHLLGVVDLSNTPNSIAADTNKDGNLNSGDLLKIQKYLLGVSAIEI